MLKKIVVFNGPPHSGKDTAVMAVRAVLSPQCGPTTGYAVHEKLADPLKKAVHALFSLFHDPAYYDDTRNIEQKDTPLVKLMGMSPRQAYISLSEDYVKPQFGKDAFGKMLVNKIKDNKTSTVHLLSDGGFVDEMVPLINQFGMKNFMVVELHAQKLSTGQHLTFEGDSRDYIGADLQQIFPDITYRRIYNDIGTHEDKEFFRSMVIAAVKKFLEME